MSPQSLTREKLIETTRVLFWERGYEATSLADVLEKAGARSGSLYHFFRTKEELLLAVLDRYVDLLWPIVIEPAFSRVSDPIARIFGILDGYRQGLVCAGCTQGCPIGNLALEVCDDLPRAREKISQNFEGWRGWICKCLDEAKDRFPLNVNREQLAVFVLTAMEGAVTQARAQQSLEPYDASVAQLRDHFDRLLADGARKKGPALQ